MSWRRSNRFVLCFTLSILLLAVTWPMVVEGGTSSTTPGVLPPQSSAFGQSYADWSTSWVQWALSFSNDESPLFDETGALAANGQSGDVWFLAGVIGASGTVERSITVPNDTALFFPLYNFFWVNTPEFGDNPWSPEQEAFARGVAADAVDQVSSISAEIDGRPVKDLQAYRLQTDEPFLVDMPDDNLFGIPAGTYGPSVTDGYYLMLAPLTAGRHSIHFHTVAGDNVQDVTYHIRVKG